MVLERFFIFRLRDEHFTFYIEKEKACNRLKDICRVDEMLGQSLYSLNTFQHDGAKIKASGYIKLEYEHSRNGRNYVYINVNAKPHFH